MIAASDEYDVRLSYSVALAQGARLQRSNSNRRSPCPRGATDAMTIVRNQKKLSVIYAVCAQIKYGGEWLGMWEGGGVEVGERRFDPKMKEVISWNRT